MSVPLQQVNINVTISSTLQYEILEIYWLHAWEMKYRASCEERIAGTPGW